jgi:hypothetical protein
MDSYVPLMWMFLSRTTLGMATIVLLRETARRHSIQWSLHGRLPTSNRCLDILRVAVVALNVLNPLYQYRTIWNQTRRNIILRWATLFTLYQAWVYVTMPAFLSMDIDIIARHVCIHAFIMMYSEPTCICPLQESGYSFGGDSSSDRESAQGEDVAADMEAQYDETPPPTNRTPLVPRTPLFKRLRKTTQQQRDGTMIQ